MDRLITIYDPALDPDRSCALRLVTLLEQVLEEHTTGSGQYHITQ